MTTIIGILVGALLGTRFKVFCLVPVALAGTIVVAVLEQIHGVAPGATALSALAFTIALQIGYFLGAVATFSTSLSKQRRLRGQPARIS